MEVIAASIGMSSLQFLTMWAVPATGFIAVIVWAIGEWRGY